MVFKSNKKGNLWLCLLLAILANTWNFGKGNSVTGNFDHCKISCSNNEQHQDFAFTSQATTIAGKKGPKGDQGLKGEPGSPGRNCFCQEFTDKLLDLKKEYEVLKEHLASRPTSCSDIKDSNSSAVDGVYTIFPFPNIFHELSVKCDMSTDGGGWTVFQRREDGSVDFEQLWEAYENGFGEKSGEHWLGLANIRSLLKGKKMELRIDVADFQNNWKHAIYKDFFIGPAPGYALNFGKYSGDAGDSFTNNPSNNHQGMKFSTSDRSEGSSNCADAYHSGWWFNSCFTANLNGVYVPAGRDQPGYWQGIIWSSFGGGTNCLKASEMKFREM